MRHIPLRKISIGIIAMILIMALWGVFLPVWIQSTLAGRATQAFDAENEALGDAIATLGPSAYPHVDFQCFTDKTTHTQTRAYCQKFAAYRYQASPVSEYTRQHFETNAAKLDKLLKSRGWTIDRPHDAVTTIANSDPYTAANHQNGGEVPYHKNIGPVSCNLSIDVSGPTAYNSVPSGAMIVNVNTFGCSQNIRYFYPHFRTYVHYGA